MLAGLFTIFEPTCCAASWKLASLSACDRTAGGMSSPARPEAVLFVVAPSFWAARRCASAEMLSDGGFWIPVARASREWM